MPPRFVHGRTKRGFGVTSIDASVVPTQLEDPTQIPAAQTLPSIAPQPPAWSPPNVGDQGVPDVSPIGAPYTGAQQTRMWWGGDNTYDGLIFRDRHPMFSSGTEIAGRVSSRPDPPMDGPPRRDMRLINRTWNWQAGTGQAYQDDRTRAFTWLGQQDGTWSPIYGGQPGFFRWGPGGVPSTADAPGPGRVFAGPPHGLHTMYPPDRQQVEARYTSIPQMRPTRVDRLSNSRISGQSYSERTLHQGERPDGARFRGKG